MGYLSGSKSIKWEVTGERVGQTLQQCNLFANFLRRHRSPIGKILGKNTDIYIAITGNSVLTVRWTG